jgi:glyoxylate reductase
MKVFVSRMLPPAGMAELKQFAQKANVTLDVWPDELPPSRSVMLEKVKGCTGIVTLLTDTVDGTLMDAAGPQLRVVSNFAVGYNNIDCAAAVKRNIRVGNTPGVLTEATADMAFALLISAARRVPESVQYAQQGKWKTWLPLGFIGQDLKDRTVGVIGMGRIGYRFAEQCHKGWNMKVQYYDEFKNETANKELKATQVDLDTLLRTSDFISVHCNLTKATTKMIGKTEFEKMKKTAVFINTARGPIVDEKALMEACKNNTIFAAGIDVTDPEPPARDSPIFSIPNLVVAPHIASATTLTRNAMATIAARNLIAGVTSQPLQAEVPETAQAKSKI